ncbi:hypothetical protein COL922a_008085 [Colletotrichum nupharicola]|nr:hypothetical protein COL922a_008085 [Colletotrichum nupharicola]
MEAAGEVRFMLYLNEDFDDLAVHVSCCLMKTAVIGCSLRFEKSLNCSRVASAGCEEECGTTSIVAITWLGPSFKWLDNKFCETELGRNYLWRNARLRSKIDDFSLNFYGQA